MAREKYVLKRSVQAWIAGLVAVPNLPLLAYAVQLEPAPPLWALVLALSAVLAPAFVVVFAARLFAVRINDTGVRVARSSLPWVQVERVVEGRWLGLKAIELHRSSGSRPWRLLPGVYQGGAELRDIALSKSPPGARS